MKRVLIVDDEFLVRLGLKTTIDWEAHGYKIVGEAANGKEALEIFDRLDPDILLTDIKMPFMDG
ncbi:MAG TPA: DNA-binding response regulator, partial [Ruminiclostridium sp.]|nr:DNA-binding response regulator [Ruminiclostridium sp.]